MATRRLLFAGLLILFTLGSLAPQAAPTDTANSTKLKQTLAKELLALADAAADSGLQATALGLLDEALGLTPDDKKALKQREKLGGGQDAADAEAQAKFSKKAEKGRKKAATQYCELFRELFADKDQAGVDKFLERAYAHHAETADTWVETDYKTHYTKKDLKAVFRVLSIAQGRAPATLAEKAAKAREAAMREAEAELSTASPLLKQARTHTMKYYLSLPKGWSADKKWPVYVAVEGAGCNFAGACRGAAGDKNERFIVVTPCGFTNTNALSEVAAKYPYPQEVLDAADAEGRVKFDEPGLLAVLADLRELYGAEEKICISGFSGGGILTWHMIFTHPELLVAAVPACGNFSGLRGELSKHEAREKLPVRAFQGDKDEYIAQLNAQWEMAKKTADEGGWANVTREMVPGAGHSPCYEQARKVFAEFLPAPEAPAAQKKGSK